MHEPGQVIVGSSEFLEAVRRSRVVKDSALDAALADFSPAVAEGDASAETLQIARHLIEQNLVTRYQAKELLQGRFRRLRMEHFVIRDLLGVGGMGAVFRAYDLQRGQEVALKVLSERFKHDAGMRARFRLEARAGMRLDHPGIVKTYELGVTDDVFGEVDYATMEMFEAIALHELVGIMGPIPVNAACDMICQAADALSHLHSQDMVHRDVKPDNVLVDRDGKVKVIDLGLTLINEAENAAPSEEEFSLAMIFGHDCLGTPDYMPPEQADDSRGADARSDVYGLGCTLFVALTAKRPFSARSGSEIIRMHKTQPPPDPGAIVETIPPEIRRAVLKMMAKSPGDRFQSMAEVRQELEKFSTRRRIDFSFSRLIHNRMALAIKQGRISMRQTSTAMRLSNAGRKTQPRTLGSGAGSAAALQATDAPRDTAVARRGSGLSRAGEKGGRIGQPASASAAVGAEDLLRGLSGEVDEKAAATGAMLKLPDGGLFRLAKADVAIGRNRDEVDLWIDDRRLSGRHCRLNYDGTNWQVIDLESRNGTEINGRRISIAPIFGHDRLTLAGEVEFVMDWSKRRPGKGLSAWAWIILVLLASTLAGVGYWYFG
jgi:eukaryotic-like serine/threonine-protein kinase